MGCQALSENPDSGLGSDRPVMQAAWVSPLESCLVFSHPGFRAKNRENPAGMIEIARKLDHRTESAGTGRCRLAGLIYTPRRLIPSHPHPASATLAAKKRVRVSGSWSQAAASWCSARSQNGTRRS
jgi:hypothetical protein